MEGASDQEPQGWTEERAFIGFGACSVSQWKSTALPEVLFGG